MEFSQFDLLFILKINIKWFAYMCSLLLEFVAVLLSISVIILCFIKLHFFNFQCLLLHYHDNIIVTIILALITIIVVITICYYQYYFTIDNIIKNSKLNAYFLYFC